MGQLAFYFDAGACIGCKACDVACKEKNKLPSGIAWRQVWDYGGGEWVHEEGQLVPQDVFTYHVSATCMHCADPPCTQVCLSGSLSKRPDGIVINDTSACEGCRSCESVCPYGALHFDARKGVMTKCDFCADSLERKETPACIAICPQRCLDFGELQELRETYGALDSIAPLPEAAALGPSIVIVPHARAASGAAASGRILNRRERADASPLPLVAGRLLRLGAPAAAADPDWMTLLRGEHAVLALLSRLIGEFPQRERLASLAAMRLFDAAPFAAHQPDVVQGLAELQAWSARNAGGVDAQALEDLQADHTHLLVTTLGGRYAPPYESVYCGDSHLLFQSETLAVRDWYRRFGMAARCLHHEPDDHIALELAFCGHLAELALDALLRRDERSFKRCLDAQGDFAAGHLLRWAPHWCRRVESAARSDFYRGLARLTHGVLIELAAVLKLSLPADPPAKARFKHGTATHHVENHPITYL